MLDGKATTKPITQPLKKLLMNPTVHPVFIVVIVEVIVVSKAKVIKNATNKPEYAYMQRQPVSKLLFLYN